MKKIIIYYSFILVSVLIITGFLSAQSTVELVTASLFYPVLIYFSLLVVPVRKRALVLSPVVTPTKAKGKGKKKGKRIEKAEVVRVEEGKLDKERRNFVKLVGTAGATVFLFSIFGIKKAEAAFFGSVPGPGTVSLKDSAGNKIDPAEKGPTDGYKIAELDDAVPSFYGFTNKDGAWFIMKDDGAGAYRYVKGASDFPTNWTGRAGLTYDYFENVF